MTGGRPGVRPATATYDRPRRCTAPSTRTLRRRLSDKMLRDNYSHSHLVARSLDALAVFPYTIFASAPRHIILAAIAVSSLAIVLECDPGAIPAFPSTLWRGQWGALSDGSISHTRCHILFTSVNYSSGKRFIVPILWFCEHHRVLTTMLLLHLAVFITCSLNVSTSTIKDQIWS